MPCTFTHPLAVVPLRRFCGERLNFAALVIGSMSPDFGYFVRLFPVASFAHTIVGTFTICLPSGLVVLGVLYLLRRALCFMLPQPHRGALMPLASQDVPLSFLGWLIAAGCVLIGAWTHTIWDSFTHDAGWAVARLAFLRAPVLHVGDSALPLSYVIQQISTFGGGIILAFVYLRWLREHRQTNREVDGIPDRWRFALVSFLAVISCAIAAPSAVQMAAHFHGYMALRVFVFRTGVYAAAVFVPLVALCSIILYTVHRAPKVRAPGR